MEKKACPAFVLQYRLREQCKKHQETHEGISKATGSQGQKEKHAGGNLETSSSLQLT